MPYCPRCNAEIDHLNYSCNYSEYGTESGISCTDGSDCESDDRSSGDYETDNYEYTCPECDAEIDPDDVTDEPDGDDDEEEGNESVTHYENDGIAVSTNNGGIVTRQDTPSIPYKTIKCPECGQVNIFNNSNGSILCSKCNGDIIIN
jgi:hypothetical protein